MDVTKAIADAFREGSNERAKNLEELVQQEVKRVIALVIDKARKGKSSGLFGLSGSDEAQTECLKRLAVEGIHGFVKLGTNCKEHYFYWRTDGVALKTSEHRLVDFPIDDQELLSRIVAWNVECIGGRGQWHVTPTFHAFESTDWHVTPTFHAFESTDKSLLAPCKEYGIGKYAMIVLRDRDSLF